MARIPDQNAIADHRWQDTRKMETYDASAAAAPGRAQGALGSSIANLGQSIGGLLSAAGQQNEERERYETATKFLDFDLKQKERLADSQRNIHPEGDGFRDGYVKGFDADAREFFKGVPDSKKGEYDYKLRQLATEREWKARNIETTQRDNYHIADVQRGLDGELSILDKDPDSLRDSIGRGMVRIEASRLPVNRKEEIKKNFATSAEKRHIESRLQRGDDPDEVLRDIRTYPTRPPDGVSYDDEAQGGGGAGPVEKDPKAYLRSRLAPGYEKRTSDVDNLHPVMTDRLAALTAAAQEAGHDVRIISGHRDADRQAVLWQNALKKYGSAEEARRHVAPPGGSSHQSGEAVDLQYGDRGAGLGGKRTAAVDWVHANAKKFGLAFPLDHEDWHIEPVEARQGGKRYGGSYDTSKTYWQGGRVAGSSTSRVGAVSAKYESSGQGVGFVSTGEKDPGGPSYGVHQLSSKDSMPAFLRSEEGKRYADQFKGLTPGTAAFNAAYKKVAESDAEGFASAQHGYYSRTHYQPVLEHAKSLGFNVDDKGVQEALFSMAVQHGGAKKIVSAAKASTGSDVASQIRSLYEKRSEYVQGIDLPGETKSAVLSRYKSEVDDALKASGQASSAPPLERRGMTAGMRTPAQAKADASGKMPEGIVSEINSRGSVTTILDGIPDDQPLSAVPADTRAKLMAILPKDAEKQVTMPDGSKASAMDVVTVGQVKQAFAAPAEQARDAAVAGAVQRDDDGDGEPDLAPGYADNAPYRWLSNKDRKLMAGKAIIAQRETFKKGGDDEAARVRKYGMGIVYPDGSTYLEKAKRILTPNQYQIEKNKIDKAKWQFDVLSPLPDMSEAERARHLEKVGEQVEASKFDPGYDDRAKVFEAAVVADAKARQTLEKDAAAGVMGSREVREVATRIKSSKSLGTGPDGQPVVVEETAKLTPYESRMAMIEARLAAQERIFGDARDPRTKIVTEAEARQIIQIGRLSDMDEKELDDALKEGAARADKYYGPHARRAFDDAVKLLITSKTGRESAAGVLQSMARGEPLSAMDMQRQAMFQQMDPVKSFLNPNQVPSSMDGVGVSGRVPPPKPAAAAPPPKEAGWMERMFGSSAPKAPAQPKAPPVQTVGPVRDYVAPPAAPNDGRRPAIATPTMQDIQWLLQNPAARASGFDRGFGPGSSQMLMEFLQKNGPAMGLGQQPGR